MCGVVYSPRVEGRECVVYSPRVECVVYSPHVEGGSVLCTAHVWREGVCCVQPTCGGEGVCCVQPRCGGEGVCCVQPTCGGRECVV